MSGANPPAPGCLFIVSAPSGAGKSTLCAAAVRRHPELRYSISSTTRPPRPGERDGADYFFLDGDAFRKGIAEGRWAEWAEVHGHYYGTSAAFLEREMGKGRSLLLDIDVQGTRQMLERYPDSVTIFILPPSLEVLRERLAARGTDPPEVIARRMAAAASEMACRDLYRHVVVNDRLDEAVERFVAIIGSRLAQRRPHSEGA